MTDKANCLDIEDGKFKAGADYTLLFLAGLHAAQPVTKYQNRDTSKGGEAKIQRTQRNEGPTSPETDQMTHPKTEDAQAKKQDQSPETSAAYQMIDRAVKQRNENGK